VMSLSETRDISLLLYNTPLFTFYPSITQASHINYTFQPNPENTEEMLVTVTPVAKPVAGIDFPVNHETFPNDCESVGCKKIEGWYRPRSWVLITNEYDKDEEENKGSHAGTKRESTDQRRYSSQQNTCVGNETQERSSKSGTNDTNKNHIGTNEEGPRETYGKENCANTGSN
jgi:hypothetical protein